MAFAFAAFINQMDALGDAPYSIIFSKSNSYFFGFLVAGGGNQRALGDILFVSVASEDRRRTCPAEESPSSTGQGAG